MELIQSRDGIIRTRRSTAPSRSARVCYVTFVIRSDTNPVVVVSRPGIRYVLDAPFDPPNPVYEMVEATLRGLGLDAARAGTPEWNPLGDLIQPGDRVLIKPNFVTSKNFEEHLRGEKLACSSTHGSVLRPLLDYALRAAGPRGKVTIVDTPVEGCNLEEVVDGLGVRALLDWYAARGTRIDLIDLRHFRVVPHMALDDVKRFGRSLNLGLLVRERLPGDPLGYTVVDVGERSYFDEVAARAPQFCFHRSHKHTPVPHHGRGRHEYSIPRTVLDADVVINIPKLKTHKKSGVTLALKSCIGLTNEKYWLPHYTVGTPAESGDEFPFPPPLARALGEPAAALSAAVRPFAHRARAQARRGPLAERLSARLHHGRQLGGQRHHLADGARSQPGAVLRRPRRPADRSAAAPLPRASSTASSPARAKGRWRRRRATPACSSPDAIRRSSTPPARARWATASGRSA